MIPIISSEKMSSGLGYCEIIGLSFSVLFKQHKKDECSDALRFNQKGGTV